MKNEKVIQELKLLEKELRDRLAIVENLIQKAESGEEITANELRAFRVGHQLQDCSYFKGKKAEAVIFADGSRVEVRTWKQAVAVIMKACNADTAMHGQLIKLCGKVYGRQRVLLADSPEKLQVPIEIDGCLYFEGRFDTQSLLEVMTKRILDEVGFDYSGIRIECRKVN